MSFPRQVLEQGDLQGPVCDAQPVGLLSGLGRGPGGGEGGRLDRQADIFLGLAEPLATENGQA